MQVLFVRSVYFLTIGTAILALGTAPVGASAATSQLACTPTNLGFGAVVVGQTETLLVTLTNNGRASVMVSGIAVSQSEFTTSNLSLPLVLLAGQSVDLSVSFTPTALGWTGGTIKFSSNASNATLRLEVAGTGVSTEAVTASPSTVSFGQVVIGTISTVPVVLTNARSWNVTLSALQTTGGGFSTSGPSFPLTLGAGQSVTENVAFAPQSAGTTGGKLFISGPGLAIPLNGTGTAPVVVVEVTPANVSVTVGATQQFAASVTGTPNTAVVWTVSGTGCSGTACGTISSSGLYTAPAAVPSPANVTTTATSVADPTKSASVGVTITAIVGTSYYLATAADGGSDSNNGLSSDAPWLTPNHAVNCGDTITAAASTSYSASNFATGKWGTVTCSAGNSVAWLKCATFDACKIIASGDSGAIWVDKSYWGVQGWEVTITGGAYSFCFAAYPNYSSPVQISHIIFANDIANGCQGNGFSSANIGTASVDYFAVLGNIAYDASQGNGECFSGISVYQPVASDSLPGTHIYIAGNFSWGNFDPNPCSGGIPTDGEGIILDTLNGSQGGVAGPYTQQVVVDNNIIFLNGGRGIAVGGGGSTANVYLRHNTGYGNNGDTKQNGTWCGDILLMRASNVQAFYNVAATDATNGCGANPIYAFFVGSGDDTDQVYNNWGYSAAGTNDGLASSPGFSYGPNNTFFTNPSFSNPVNPGAPNCSSASSVPNCMATVIANFTPTASAAIGYGYQIPSSTQTYDPLFPQWLCNVNLPSGLTTMGCLAQ
jgi:hypothetical protein